MSYYDGKYKPYIKSLAGLSDAEKLSALRFYVDRVLETMDALYEDVPDPNAVSDEVLNENIEALAQADRDLLYLQHVVMGRVDYESGDYIVGMEPRENEEEVSLEECFEKLDKRVRDQIKEISAKFRQKLYQLPFSEAVGQTESGEVIRVDDDITITKVDKVGERVDLRRKPGDPGLN